MIQDIVYKLLPTVAEGESELSLCILTLCNLMDFPIQVNTIRMGLSIVYYKGSLVEISK